MDRHQSREDAPKDGSLPKTTFYLLDNLLTQNK